MLLVKPLQIKHDSSVATFKAVFFWRAFYIDLQVFSTPPSERYRGILEQWYNLVNLTNRQTFLQLVRILPRHKLVIYHQSCSKIENIFEHIYI
jgi:hypothetical protein